MSTDEAKPNRPRGIRFSYVDSTLSRVEKYGLATVLLVTGLVWIRPILNDLFQDHREFMKSTSATMAKQSEILSNSSSRLDHIETTTEKSGEMIRDIHGKVVVLNKQHQDEVADKK